MYKLDKQLAGKDWLVGDLTFVDFWAWEIIDHHKVYKTDLLDKFPNLNNWHKRFLDLPSTKTTMASDDWTKFPINAVIAKFQGGPGPLLE